MKNHLNEFDIAQKMTHHAIGMLRCTIVDSPSTYSNRSSYYGNLSDNMGLYKDVGTKSFKGISSLGQINLTAWHKLTQKQMEIFSLATEAGINSLKSFADKPDFQQVSLQQAEITKQLGEKISSKNQELIELTTELRDEYIAFTEEQISGINLNFNTLNR